jgi:hypothetical protein
VTAKPCKACEHPERATIDRALLVAGQSPRSIVRRYSGISRREIQKHRDVCLAANGERRETA